MAIIVDKVQKRKDIALACKEIFFQNGINDLTVSQVAKTAGVGKGTIYDYFKNKEDIVFEIVNILMQEHNETMHKKLKSESTTREKIKVFASIFYDDNEKELRQLYKEFISISLTNPDKEMVDFQTAHTNHYYNWFVEILNEGIEKGEIIDGSQEFARGLFVMAKGMFISSSVTNTIDDLKSEIDKFTDALFNLIEVKK
ncbi:transcriptional regulator, TetR family [Sulfurimonas gotlandica GD1]|jgi:AcrR family transcriptional regulator|uniref:Transcriptional regulator, TetR family n=1 Tax=Sulfurimonas gotlandica (strain DSM 19862 / JCM 16533 / GD1) TaxID=929558 RepID=B6BMY1_SULGG|nr:TetR/AcrR family transcriptional regulator [Sulfurimonas gotlandica]EDZ61517.1 transcriptional regulator, TetR family protein [Sulfurimonas gotlandica GD1]EHP30746.1 transcriptional regulator, TetR family [Sulfurimonas gotlandica GD1]